MEILIFFLPVIYYCAYLLFHTWKFIQYNPPARYQQLSISVIIPIRNESKYIEDCIKSILVQNYPNNLLEIIIVNDHSEDQTLQILKKFEQIPNLKILHLPMNKIGKKEAIQWGIENATGEIIITTDGDTLRGKYWVQTLVNFFSENTAMVSGPVKLTGKSIWQEMQALEFAGLILLGAAMIANKKPSLCNGANLAYRKKVFYEVNGFQNIKQIASGDDELLLHKIRNLKKYDIVFAKNIYALVETPAQNSLKTFIHQRLRWTSKSTVYPDKWVTIHLIMAYLANLSIFIAFIYIFLKNNAWIFTSLMIMKIFSEWIVLKQATQFIQQTKILRWIIVEQILHILYVLWVGLVSQLKFQYNWKGRKVK